MIAENEKRCSRCYVIRLKTRFSKKAAAKDGLRSECKVCASIDFDKRKDAGRIKIYETGYKSFKVRYGVAYTTIRDWLLRSHTNGTSKYWLLTQIPIEERQEVVDTYKLYKRTKDDKIKQR